ncbi:MAG: hypothetical protein JKY55_04975 [Aliivibrio sp.]|uniref:hypothetical protein n=1 Tax=Aliivibrio sp. TaxID=1872443 RepID=UPI001A45456B|nr:hypothetical protein [Aliivibrio sp.]
MIKNKIYIPLLFLGIVATIVVLSLNGKSNSASNKSEVKNSEISSMVGLVSQTKPIEISEQADYPAPIQQLQQAMTHSMLHEQQENEFLLSNKLPRMAGNKVNQEDLPKEYSELKSRLKSIENVLSNTK